MGLKLMKIELCSEDRLKITLKYEDLRALSLSFDDLDYAEMETRRVIWELLDEASRQTGFDSSGGRLLIEALPLLDGGCILYFTVLPRDLTALQGVGKLQCKRLCGPYVYEFPSAEELLCVCTRLWHEQRESVPKSTAYRFGRGYRLVVYTKEGKVSILEPLLKEYGEFAGEGAPAAAYAAEHGQVLAEEDAIMKIGQYGA